MKATFFGVLAAVALTGQLCFAGDIPGTTESDGPEDFHFQVLGSAWLVNSAGNIQASGTPVDLVSDLGVQEQQPTFYGNFVFKFTKRQEIVIEGMPLGLTGNNTIDRSLTYHGETFQVSDTVHSNASLDYFFAGYQYNVLNGPMGHLGFSAGGAYVGATGTITSVTTNTTATRTETIGLPLAGMDFRVFPIPHRRWLDIDGGIRGMNFASYGFYTEANANGGVWIGRFGLLAGYRVVNADLHNTNTNASGINIRLKGPIFSLAFQW